jgi:hypothetical protein
MSMDPRLTGQENQDLMRKQYILGAIDVLTRLLGTPGVGASRSDLDNVVVKKLEELISQL